MIDSIKGITDAINFAMKELNYASVSEEYVSTIVNNGDVYLLASALRSSDKSLIDTALKIFRNFYLENCYALPYEGVTDVLKKLSESNKKVGVISNKPYLIAEKQLRQTGLLKYVNLLKADDGSIKLKPHPDSIEQILRETASSKKETLMVGDSIVDIRAGKAAGVLTCGVTYGNTAREIIMKACPDYLIDDIRQVIELPYDF